VSLTHITCLFATHTHFTHISHTFHTHFTHITCLFATHTHFTHISHTFHIYFTHIPHTFHIQFTHISHTFHTHYLSFCDTHTFHTYFTHISHTYHILLVILWHTHISHAFQDMVVKTRRRQGAGVSLRWAWGTTHISHTLLVFWRLSACFYEVVSCVYAFFFTFLSTYFACAACFVFCSIFRTTFCLLSSCSTTSICAYVTVPQAIDVRMTLKNRHMCLWGGYDE